MPKKYAGKDYEPSQFVKLAGALGGIFLVITLFFLIFAPDQAAFLATIAWAFVVLGIVLGAFQLKALQKPKAK